MKAKCKAEVESKVKMMDTMWPDIVPCKRNASEGSEFCAAHDPNKKIVGNISKKAIARIWLEIAAPDMLDALKEVAADLGGLPEHGPLLRRVQSVIAKAERNQK